MSAHLFSREHIRRSLAPQAWSTGEHTLSLAGAPPHIEAQVRASLPMVGVPAAVLIPLVEHAEGTTVLLTQRAATLKDHAGQISFPGGRIESEDADAWRAALREAREEIGLTESFVAFAGYLPDHWVATGFRVTPVVGFVDPSYGLRIAAEEVHDVFEVPLQFLFDEANHKTRTRKLGGLMVEVYDIRYGERNIWGATAGMLLTLRRLLLAQSPGAAVPA